jgi:hypothetical protein
VTVLSLFRDTDNIDGTIPCQLGDLVYLESLYAPAPTLPVSESETTSCLEPHHFLYPTMHHSGVD